MSDDIAANLHELASLTWRAPVGFEPTKLPLPYGAQKIHAPVMIEVGRESNGETGEENAVFMLNRAVFPFVSAASEIERLRKALSEIAENRDEPYAADHARDALKGAE